MLQKTELALHAPTHILEMLNIKYSHSYFSQQTGMHSNSSNPAHLLKYGNPYHSWICDICTVVLSHAIRKMIRNTPSTANKQVEHIEPDLDTTAINTR